MVGVRHHGALRSREARRNRWDVRGGVVPSGFVSAYDWYPNSLLEKDISQLQASQVMDSAAFSIISQPRIFGGGQSVLWGSTNEVELGQLRIVSTGLTSRLNNRCTSTVT